MGSCSLPLTTLAYAWAINSCESVEGVHLVVVVIADAMGGKVYQNDEREIGWFPVTAVPEGKDSPFAFPASTVVFHWHGDTFSLPPGGVWLARSAGCEHQAFAAGAHVLGLQFHVEMKPADVARIARECADELTPGRFVQPAETIIARAAVEGGGTAALLDRLLGRLERG